MKKVFIGGSRKVANLNQPIQEYLEKIIEKRDSILIGDANGVDKTIQIFLQKHKYDNVEVFCMENNCRNNVGNWKTREIHSIKRKKDFNYYSTKDAEMANEASLGFMIWDGKSFGTIANIYRFIQQKKKVDVYIYPVKTLLTLIDKNDWDKFIVKYEKEIQKKIIDLFEINESPKKKLKQKNLFDIST